MRSSETSGQNGVLVLLGSISSGAKRNNKEAWRSESAEFQRYLKQSLRREPLQCLRLIDWPERIRCSAAKL
jgi:hypothetical protein